MIEGNDCAIGVIEPLRAAFTRYLVISAYLYVFFSATELYKAARLAERACASCRRGLRSRRH